MRRGRAGRGEQDALGNLCAEIVGFLEQRPTARDTLEGIVEWWFLERDLRREIDWVKEALALLVDSGAVEAKTGPDGRLLYGLARGGAESPPAGQSLPAPMREQAEGEANG